MKGFGGFTLSLGLFEILRMIFRFDVEYGFFQVWYCKNNLSSLKNSSKKIKRSGFVT